MRYIEGNDGLRPFLNDSDRAKAGLARTLVTAAKAWREAYGDIPLPGQKTDAKDQKTTEQSLFIIPEELGVQFTQKIGGKSPEQLEAEAKADREVTINASDMLHSPKFEVLEEVTPQDLLKFPVRALGLPGDPTIRQIFERIPQGRYGDYALEIPRAEVGPHLAIADREQPLNDWYYITHEPIAGRSGGPLVFTVGHDSGGRFLSGTWARPDGGWDPDDQLVVALRKIEPVKS